MLSKKNHIRISEVTVLNQSPSIHSRLMCPLCTIAFDPSSPFCDNSRYKSLGHGLIQCNASVQTHLYQFLCYHGNSSSKNTTWSYIHTSNNTTRHKNVTDRPKLQHFDCSISLDGSQPKKKQLPFRPYEEDGCNFPILLSKCTRNRAGGGSSIHSLQSSSNVLNTKADEDHNFMSEDYSETDTQVLATNGGLFSSTIISGLSTDDTKSKYIFWYCRIFGFCQRYHSLSISYEYESETQL